MNKLDGLLLAQSLSMCTLVIFVFPPCALCVGSEDFYLVKGHFGYWKLLLATIALSVSVPMIIYIHQCMLKSNLMGL